jgi:cytochrome c oxidase subunit 1
VHHQYSDPAITQGVKFFHGMLTYGVAIPSFITAFTIAASLEYAGKQRGSKGLFGWMVRLPWLDENKYLFAYFISGLILFTFGGVTGIINASYSLNSVVHNTAWLPGHFHMTVAGPVFLGIIAMSLYIYSKMSGKKVFLPKLNTIVPYLWVIGMLIFSFGMSWGGLRGEPRRTNLGTSYLNPDNELFRSDWVPTTLLALLGGIIMFIAAMIFIIIFFGTILSKKKEEGVLEIPVSEAYHDEKRVAIFDKFKPWLVTMIVIILLAYIPALFNVNKNSGPKAPRFNIDNPVPQVSVKQ